MNQYFFLFIIFSFTAQSIAYALVAQRQTNSRKLSSFINCPKLYIKDEKTYYCGMDHISKFRDQYWRTEFIFSCSGSFMESNDKVTKGIWKRISLGNKELSKAGQSALLAYALVSNICTVCCFTLAWISHGRIYHCSPFSKRQWKAFGLIYAGLWTANNLLRPLRISTAIALSPLYDKAIDKLSVRTGLQRNASCLIIILCVNVLGTLTALSLGALIGSKVAQVPLLQS